MTMLKSCPQEKVGVQHMGSNKMATDNELAGDVLKHLEEGISLVNHVYPI